MFAKEILFVVREKYVVSILSHSGELILRDVLSTYEAVQLMVYLEHGDDLIL